MMRSYCTPGGKSAAVSTTFSSLAPGQVAVPAIACAQPVSATKSSASTDCSQRHRRIMRSG